MATDMGNTMDTANAQNPISEDCGGQEKQTARQDCNPKLLDLAFAMDCTGSMGSYIHEAQRNIRLIVEEIVSKEKADVRLALVEYRDHPPQDRTFVTRVNDFSPSVKKMKGWLDQCKAQGGGDAPEAVADALHQVLKLSWRPDAVKICVFISDAPPHGLNSCGDSFPNGCPDGLDPMEITNELAQKGVTLYLVGCEPAINPYKEFFSAIAHLTGGQYVPLRHAKLLSSVIIGGAAEELSLTQLMQEVENEVRQEAAAAEEIDEEDLSSKIHARMKSRGVKAKKLMLNKGSLPQASEQAQELSYCKNMVDVRSKMPQSSTSFNGRTKSAGYARVSSARKTRSLAPEPSLMSAPAACEDMYEVEEDNAIEQEQVSRMVQKAVMKNNFRDRVKKK